MYGPTKYAILAISTAAVSVSAALGYGQTYEQTLNAAHPIHLGVIFGSLLVTYLLLAAMRLPRYEGSGTPSDTYKRQRLSNDKWLAGTMAPISCALSGLAGYNLESHDAMIRDGFKIGAGFLLLVFIGFMWDILRIAK